MFSSQESFIILPHCSSSQLLFFLSDTWDNYSYANTLKKIGGAELIEEKDLSGESLINAVESLINNKPKLTAMSESLGKNAIIDANERIYEVLMQIYTNV